MRTPYNEFEDFLKQHTDEHRMYPSDKLWRNIQLTLHGESRWPALTYISILIIAALVVSTLLVKPEERMKKNVAAYVLNNNGNITKVAVIENIHAAEQNSPVQSLYTEKITQHTIETINEKVSEEHVSRLTAGPHFVDENIAITETKAPSLASAIPQLIKTQEVINTTSVKTSDEDKSVALANSSKPASKYFSTLGLMNITALKLGNSVVYSNTTNDNQDVWRSFPLFSAQDIIRRNLSKFDFQFYITPSISYRKLTDAKGNVAPSYTAIPLSSNYKINLNRVVKHTPSIGAEIGFGLGYHLTDNLAVKSGIQFNLRQYNIEAYLGKAEQPIQSAEADNLSPASGDYTASLHSMQSDDKAIVLRNKYYEIAVPIGLDYKIFSGNNGIVSWNVAASLQPTYTFDKEPLVITTNYKNYTDGSSIMRNWNLNSSVETYITYKIGPLRWQVGPQFRYQHLSTYSDNYPIREHLFDYGLKIGFTKTLD